MTSELEGTMLRRDGHVSGVGIDRYLYEDLVPAQRRIVESHMNECAACAARIQEAREADLAAVIPPMPELPRHRETPTAEVIPLWRRGAVRAAAGASRSSTGPQEASSKPGRDQPGSSRRASYSSPARKSEKRIGPGDPFHSWSVTIVSDVPSV